MRVVLALAVVLLTVACREAATPTPGPLPTRPAEPLVGIVWDAPTSWGIRNGTLVRLDRRTLRPRSQPRLELGRYGYSAAVSPDGATLALGGFRSGILLVERRTLQPIRRLRAADSPGLVLGLAWPGPQRVVATVGAPLGHGNLLRTASIDVQTGRILQSESVPRELDVLEIEPDGHGGLVALRGERNRIRPAEVVHIDAGGRARAVKIGVVAGAERRSLESFGRRVTPGLAVDAVAGTAYVVAGGSTLARVDLAAGTASLTSLRPKRSILGRLWAWLEPEAAAKGEAGPVTDAASLGGGVLAVTGYAVGGDGRNRAAGLKLVDADAGNVSMLDNRTDRMLVAGELVVAFGGDGEREPAPGVAAFTREGDLLWRRFAGRPVFWAQAARGRVYVQLRGRAVALRLADGQTVGPARTPLPRILPDD